MNPKEHLRTLIVDFFAEAKLMQLATSRNNQPWVCTVWFATDNDLNIYWLSSTTRRHSTEVVENEHVAGAITVAQTPSDLPRGLQFEGVAELLTEQEDIDKAFSVYAGRIFSREQIQEFMDDDETPHKFYKIKPARIILLDAVNFPDQPPQEYIVK